MITYGLISKTDAQCIEKTLSLIMDEFTVETIYTLEVGIFNGHTSRAINDFILSKGRDNFHTTIDNQKDFETKRPFEECHFIIGNSNEVYNQIPDKSQHFIFIDANHAFPHVVSDFFCYQDKVRTGGYIAFHDTGKHIKPFTGYQLIGDKNDPDMHIAVRKALGKIGLLNDEYGGWELVFDEADQENEMSGICVFKKHF